MYEIDKVSYLRIGQQGENQSVTIELDMTSWADEHPDASFAILFKPYNEDLPSPVYTTYDEPVLTWVVGSSVTQNVGVGYTEIRAFSASGLIKKSKVIPTSVESSVSGGSSPTPPAYTDWVNSVLSAKDTAVSAKTAAETAQAAAEAAQAAAEEAGLSDAAKAALLNCLSHVVWTDSHGQLYYNTLYSALYANAFPRIVATYNPENHVVYTDDALDTLKTYLTVVYYETPQSAGTTISSSDYTLSGTLAAGQSTIVVQYGTFVSAFVVSAVDFYNIWNWSLGNNTLQKVLGGVNSNQSDTEKYPSRINFDSSQSGTRRTFAVSRGKAPYYVMNETAEATEYYPIPIPDGANHIKIHIDTGRYIYAHVVPYNESTHTYGDSDTSARIQWTQDTGAGLETIVPSESNKWFLIVNSKYDDEGETYPTEPTTFTVEFSEV